MSSKNGKAIKSLLANIDIEKLLPKVLPGILGGMPAVRAMGITPEAIAEALAPAAEQAAHGPEIEIPEGGDWRFMRDFSAGKISHGKIINAIKLIVSDERFEGVVSEFLNTLYMAITLYDIVEAADGRPPSADRTS